MITYRQGDLFDRTGNIGHGVNAQGKMTSGIAVQFRNRFPEMHEEYLTWCEGNPAGGSILPWRDGKRWIINIVSQIEGGANADLGLLRLGLSNAESFLRSQGEDQFSIPMIGSGVGGLDPDTTLVVFNDVFRDSPVSLEVVSFDA